ncbi:MAG TPA: HypC/HybG/HupF family hydrogenase formation chaperone [Motiliproteus sp.]
MCIGVPSRVIALDGLMATVESLGQTREVSLILMGEEVAIGDYLLIQVGNFAVEIIEPQRAEEALAFLREMNGLLPENAAAQ